MISLDHWAITTSSGRRVSLLCDDDDNYSCSSNTAPTPPLSPDHINGRPYRALSFESSSSSSSSVRSNSPRRMYSPPTPPSLSLPPLDKLLPVHEHHFFPPLATSKPNSFSMSPTIPQLSTNMEEGAIPSISQASPISDPPSPKSPAANPMIKRSSRRYTCHCGKSFTTSGHLARHTRIHTGEKNYVCPEVNCGARFSRQDNCMQHYRTHQSGSASKRAARRRRMSTDSSASGRERENDGDVDNPVTAQQHSLPYRTSQPYVYDHHLSTQFTAEGGLAALASVAIASYP
ncbi:hypothetical protein EV426DRAFT_535782 [Tirmania nivea]|nr:hypothetical protein EV426DRAFT_535782 [Tirmania nivea]